MPYSRRGANDERNYRMVSQTLAVLVQGEYAGKIDVYERGFARFEYDRSYDGPSVSVRMSKGDGPFNDDVVRPWIEGLLPDNSAVRNSMAEQAGCSHTNPFLLLEHFGRDCPGAVQLCPPDEVATVLMQEGSYEPISNVEIGRRLREAKSSTDPVWTEAEEHWSLGGAQGKISLARIGGHWNSCRGSAATTHLFKPGVEGFSLQSLDEYLCMRLAWECGLQVAPVSYEEFDGVPAIVVERYDREITSNGLVLRLHQEDLCQALGYMPKDKYTPSPAEILVLLAADQDGRSINDFVSALFFNYLIGATDAHAKNYSLMHLADDDVFLAPLYDVASIFPYAKKKRGARVAAMPIGKEKRFGRLTGSNIDRFARSNELDEHACRDLMERLAILVHDKVEKVVHDNLYIGGVRKMGPELVRTVRANCEAMLCNMERDGKTLDATLCPTIDSGRLIRS
ncbi:MAG: HipA domain-containing protein [Atopobiaceae bacterium]|nr:HipA domain-containing protein [Atopobiaceae bacterium]